MRVVTLVPVTVLLLMIFNSEARKQNKMCYTARICIHDGYEKCGVDGHGKVRRFLDSCDLLEYNCLYKTEFNKTSMNRCKNLPKIVDEKKKGKAKKERKN